MRFGLGVLLALVLLSAGPARADRARDAREVAILMDALSKSQSSAELVKTVVTRIRTELGECATSRIDPNAASDCIEQVTVRAVERAYNDGKGQLDLVERTVLKRFFAMTILSGSDIKVNPQLDPGAPGKGIDQPDLYNYRDHKKQFADLRRAKGQPEALDPAVAALVSKAYFRKMKGAGKLGGGQIGPEEYLAARFSRMELNTLSALLVELIDRMAHSSGRIVLDRPDYASRAARIDDLEQEVADLSARIARAAAVDQPALLGQLAKTRDALAKERQGMKADQLYLRIEEKRAELDQAVDAVLAPNIDSSERATRAGRVDRLNSEIDDLQKQLAAERDEIALPPSDVDKIAVKALKIEMKKLTEKGTFKGQQLEFGDVVMAAWVSGEIDSELLKAVLDMDALGEPRESVLKRIASVAWPIANSLASVNPYSAVAVMIAGIVMTSVEQAKERKKEEEDEGSLVRE